MKIKVGNVCRVIYPGSWAQGWPCVIESAFEENLYCTVFGEGLKPIQAPGARNCFEFIGKNDLITYINEL